MKATRELHELGQSLWVDNITRGMLNDGVLLGYIDELSVTGLTSNPTIFTHPHHPETPVIASWNTTGEGRVGPRGATNVLDSAHIQRRAVARWENEGGSRRIEET